jgi:hypothetical protein
VNRDQAEFQARGYAWGREDGNGVNSPLARKTSPAADGRPDEIGSWSFARAYARAVANASCGTAYLPSVSSAYEGPAGIGRRDHLPERTGD